MNSDNLIPGPIQKVLDGDLTPDLKFKTVLQLLVSELKVDRCFLYMRDPEKEVGKIVFCVCRDASIPDVSELNWKNDTKTLPQEDPLFRAALNAEPSIFVEDVEKASPETLNKKFEATTFGHRALVHTHIVDGGKLWGILQPAIFGNPRIWTQSDKDLILAITDKLKQLVIVYVKSLKL